MVPYLVQGGEVVALLVPDTAQGDRRRFAVAVVDTTQVASTLRALVGPADLHSRDERERTLWIGAGPCRYVRIRGAQYLAQVSACL